MTVAKQKIGQYLVEAHASERALTRVLQAQTKTGAGQADEPWPGYDRQTVPEIRSALSGSNVDRAHQVVRYERAHKDRAGVIDAAEHVTAVA